MFNDRRGLLSRAFDVCLGIFIAAVLLHFAVCLLLGIKWWLIGGVLLALGVTTTFAIIRARNERW